MRDELVDRIYEAAFVPEQWVSALEGLAAASGSASGGMLVFDGDRPVGVRATSLTREIFETFSASDLWRQSERLPHYQAHPVSGFVRADDYFPAHLQARDGPLQMMRQRGLDWQSGTIIPLPTGELVAFTFERSVADGPHDSQALALLQSMHSHLARAGMMAARLRLERARNTADTLQALGLPGAVLTRGGRVLAVNPLFEAMPAIFAARASDRIALADAGANGVFGKAMERAAASLPVTLSVPVPATEKHPAMVVHLLPLRRAAFDIFAGGEVLLVATMPSASAMVPSANVLHGLFDLTPAEARLAAALAEGRTLRQAATGHGNQFSTARSQLESIFRKTGTNKQSQLVALLQSVAPLKRDV